MLMCYSIPLRGNRVSPNYSNQWQFTVHQGITYSKPVINKDTRTMWVSLLVYLYWLLWTSPQCLHLWLWAGICLLNSNCRMFFGNKDVQGSQFTLLTTNNTMKLISTLLHVDFTVHASSHLLQSTHHVHVSSHFLQFTLYWSSFTFMSFSPQFILFIASTIVHLIHIYYTS